MKVALLPYNIASDISHKAMALRGLRVESRGLALDTSSFQSADGVEVLSRTSSGGFNRVWNDLNNSVSVYKALRWADIVHWFWGFGVLPLDLDQRLIRLLKKPGVIQWMGSDIRNPDIDRKVNPYYDRIFDDEYEYKSETAANSMRNQLEFARIGFYPLEFIGTAHYISHDLFPTTFRTAQGLRLSEYVPNYPHSGVRKPTILHSPSAPGAKGTKYVFQAIERLRRDHDFEFVLIEGVSRDRALQVMRGCDIYIDQLILGSHGFAAVEAMAFGKPVVCYINPVIGKDYPRELPIVNANPDNLAEQLAILIENAELRLQLGIRGRQYVEKYHTDDLIARDLLKTYEKVIELHKSQPRRN